MGSSGAYCQGGSDEAIDRYFASSHDDGAPIAALKPLIAGARARGICDAFSMMDRAVILLDAFGMALHANPQAHALLGQGLWLDSGHLIAANIAETRAIQAMIARALAGDCEPAPLCVARQNSKPLSLNVLLLQEASGETHQLLKAILLIN